MRYVRWFGVPALIALATAWVLVPGERATIQLADAMRDWAEFSTAVDELQAVREMVKMTEDAAYADSVPVRAGERLNVRAGPGISPAGLNKVRSLVDAELNAAAPGGPKHPIALAVRVDSTIYGILYRRSQVLPTAAGEPCTIVFRAGARWLEHAQSNQASRILGVCAFFAAYGTPGPEVARWLRETRALPAAWLRAPVAFAVDTSLIDLREARGLWRSPDPDLYGCRAGRRDACERFAAPDPLARIRFTDAAPPTRAEQLSRTAPNLVGTRIAQGGNASAFQAGLLGALAEEVGPERFGEIWRGSGTIAEGYEAASGRPLSAWVYDYLAARTTDYDAGPGIGLLQVFLALALVAGSALLAFTRAPRRML